MDLFKCIIFIAIMIVIPLVIGRPFSVRYAKDKNSLLLGWITGILLMFVIFYPLALIFTDKENGLIWVCIFWSVIIVGLCVFSVIKYGKNLVFLVKKGIANIRFDILFIIAFFIIAFQIAYVCVFWHSDADDATYVGMATTSYFTDTINAFEPELGTKIDPWQSLVDYALSPFGNFFAMIGKIIGLHPSIIMHTLNPIIFISFSYFIYFLIGKELFKRKTSQYIFLISVAILNLFGNWAIRSTSTFLLFRVWQGKAFACSVLLPLVVYIFLRFLKKKPKLFDWLLLLFAFTSLSFSSGMGTLMLFVAVPIISIVYVIATKRILDLLKILLCASPNILVGISLIVL